MSLPSTRMILKHFDNRDPKMASVIRHLGPFVLKRNRNSFQVLCSAIIAQQISTKAADAIKSRFQNLFNRSRPTPKKVLEISEEVLRNVGLSRQKVSYLRDLSQHFAEGRVRPHSFHYLSNEEIIQQLTIIHGIGRWTAEMFLIFSLNRLDVLPVDDLGFRVAVKNIYNMKKEPTTKRMRDLGKKWHPYETVATWYAWRSLNNDITVY